VDFEHEQFDQYGEYRHWPVSTHSLVCEEEFFDTLEYFEVVCIVDGIIDTLRPDNVRSTHVAHLSNVNPVQPNFELPCMYQLIHSMPALSHPIVDVSRMCKVLMTINFD
jgi:hypothetical protein